MTVHLRGITWEHARGHGSQVAASAAYTALHPDVRIDWDVRSLLSFGDAGLADLAAGYDLLVIDHPHIPAAARGGLFVPLDGRGRDDRLASLAAHSVGASHASYAFEGHQWAVACDAAAQVAVHRPDLIAEPPRTWDEVLELASEGVVLWPAKPVDAFSSLVSVATGIGGSLGSAPGTFLDDEVAGEALEVLHRLRDAVDDACLTMSPIDAAERLTADDRFVFAPLLYGYTNYSREGFRRSRLAYVDAPEGPRGVPGSMLGGAGVAVSATSSEQDTAIDYALWVADAPAQRGAFFDGGGQPAHSDAWDDAGLNRRTTNFFTGTRRTLEAAAVRPRHVGYPRFQNAIAPMVTATLAGEATDADLIRSMSEEADRLLRDDLETEAHRAIR